LGVIELRPVRGSEKRNWLKEPLKGANFMCGICGTAGFAQHELLERMTDLMSHRGPDDRGVFVSSDRMFGLGNRRLSIIDLSSAGHMPMSNEDKTIWISYNGEIYNFPTLRTELEGLGHQFRSHTDSEVLVHGYEQWGLDLLSRLNGMFALGLVDLRTRPAKLLLARDRFGIKPLYYTELADRLVFASEIKSILAVPNVTRELDVESLHRYLAFLWVPGPKTMFKNIFKLPPGHYMQWCDGRLSIRSYWDLRFEPIRVKDDRELAAELRHILSRSVERQLVSDVPVGVFLSGGLDSSTIAAMAAKASSESLNTYTIAYRPEDSVLEQSDEDASAAREVSRYFHTRHHEIVVSPDIADLLPKVVWHLDEPVADAAAISTYLICNAAGSSQKVLLSGQGGDEIFAGYRVYTMASIANSLKAIPKGLRNGPGRLAVDLLPKLKNHIPGVSPGLVLAAHRYLTKVLAGVDLGVEQRFAFSRSYYTDNDLLELYGPDLKRALNAEVAADRHLEHFKNVGRADFLNRMLYVDAKTFLPELNLTYSDKLSSAASVEVRVPLLDNEIVDFMSRVPADLKIKGFKTKYLMRRAVEGMLPDRVLRRRKAGFGAPIRTWLRRDLKEMVDDLLSNDVLEARGHFDPQRVRRMISDDRDGNTDNSYRIWALLTLELWQRTFIDSVLPSSTQGNEGTNAMRSELPIASHSNC
jgi:asparagine synthase (glutamine-hydrolysing)